jgi:hypothetical protein
VVYIGEFALEVDMALGHRHCEWRRGISRAYRIAAAFDEVYTITANCVPNLLPFATIRARVVAEGAREYFNGSVRRTRHPAAPRSTVGASDEEVKQTIAEGNF